VRAGAWSAEVLELAHPDVNQVEDIRMALTELQPEV
jgi:hypothetical protein